MASEQLGTMFGRLSDGEDLIVDDVYKLEEIDDLWQALSERVGVTLAPMHANKGAELSDFVWGNDTRRKFKEKYAEDFEKFGYL